ncbi:DUF3833 family protein [Candidatus Accumulibacter contiguus]|uniref:DUF3833 family protein n=1 Tax=Candidatus Accumulibacter contiguus TaxID=2954381 RepID=UPI003562F4AF
MPSPLQVHRRRVGLALAQHPGVQNRSGEVIRHFHVIIDASWEKRDGVDVGTLDEHFSWSDGRTSRRVWTITRVDAGLSSG